MDDIGIHQLLQPFNFHAHASRCRGNDKKICELLLYALPAIPIVPGTEYTRREILRCLEDGRLYTAWEELVRYNLITEDMKYAIILLC
jgi:hypothetical protein